jgi:hypothetical protein
MAERQIDIPLGKASAAQVEETNRLFRQAERGDRAALAEVVRRLEPVPEAWNLLSDLAGSVEREWVARVAGANPLVAEALRRRLATMRAELGGPAPSPLEALLVRRVLACWLQAQHADLEAARLLEQGTVSLTSASYSLKRQDRANARFLAAARSLAVVRRLLAPTVQVGQVNIAHEQTNLVRGA